MFYVVVFEGFRYKRALLKSLTEFHKNPKKALEDLRAAFSSRRQVVLLDREITKALAALHQKVKSFILQVSDFVRVELLGKQEAFRVLKRALNFAAQKLQLARLKHDTFLDYYLCESHLECHRGHLKLDDYYVKVLTLKEPSAQSFPLIFKNLLEVQANFHIVTEWKKEDSGKARQGDPIEAPPLPQHEALPSKSSQRLGCSTNGRSGGRLEGSPGPRTWREHQGTRNRRQLFRALFTERRDL